MNGIKREEDQQKEEENDDAHESKEVSSSEEDDEEAQENGEEGEEETVRDEEDDAVATSQRKKLKRKRKIDVEELKFPKETMRKVARRAGITFLKSCAYDVVNKILRERAKKKILIAGLISSHGNRKTLSLRDVAEAMKDDRPLFGFRA